MVKETLLQSLQRGPSNRILQIEALFHADSNQHIVFWDDILEAFPGAIGVLNGTVVVNRARDSSLCLLEPRCIKYQADKVLEVVGGEELSSSLLGGTGTLSPTPSPRHRVVYSPETRRDIEQWRYRAALASPNLEDILLEDDYAPTTCTLTTDIPRRLLVVPTETETSSMGTDSAEDDQEENDKSRDSGEDDDDHNGDNNEARRSWFSTEKSSIMYRVVNFLAIQIFRGVASADVTEDAATVKGAVTPNGAATDNGTVTPNGADTPNSADTPSGTDRPNGDNPPNGSTTPNDVNCSTQPVVLEREASLEYAYRARTLSSYEGCPFDANELDFVRGEVLEVVDIKDKWWQARKQDGSVGIAYSLYLQLV